MPNRFLTACTVEHAPFFKAGLLAVSDNEFNLSQAGPRSGGGPFQAVQQSDQ